MESSAVKSDVHAEFADTYRMLSDAICQTNAKLWSAHNTAALEVDTGSDAEERAFLEIDELTLQLIGLKKQLRTLVNAPTQDMAAESDSAKLKVQAELANKHATLSDMVSYASDKMWKAHYELSNVTYAHPHDQLNVFIEIGRIAQSIVAMEKQLMSIVSEMRGER